MPKSFIFIIILGFHDLFAQQGYYSIYCRHLAVQEKDGHFLEWLNRPDQKKLQDISDDSTVSLDTIHFFYGTGRLKGKKLLISDRSGKKKFKLTSFDNDIENTFGFTLVEDTFDTHLRFNKLYKTTHSISDLFLSKCYFNILHPNYPQSSLTIEPIDGIDKGVAIYENGNSFVKTYYTSFKVSSNELNILFLNDIFLQNYFIYDKRNVIYSEDSVKWIIKKFPKVSIDSLKILEKKLLGSWVVKSILYKGQIASFNIDFRFEIKEGLMLTNLVADKSFIKGIYPELKDFSFQSEDYWSSEGFFKISPSGDYLLLFAGNTDRPYIWRIVPDDEGLFIEIQPSKDHLRIIMKKDYEGGI